MGRCPSCDNLPRLLLSKSFASLPFLSDIRKHLSVLCVVLVLRQLLFELNIDLVVVAEAFDLVPLLFNAGRQDGVDDELDGEEGSRRVEDDVPGAEALLKRPLRLSYNELGWEKYCRRY